MSLPDLSIDGVGRVLPFSPMSKAIVWPGCMIWTVARVTLCSAGLPFSPVSPFSPFVALVVETTTAKAKKMMSQWLVLLAVAGLLSWLIVLTGRRKKK
jgi:hypothetical protein